MTTPAGNSDSASLWTGLPLFLFAGLALATVLAAAPFASAAPLAAATPMTDGELEMVTAAGAAENTVYGSSNPGGVDPSTVVTVGQAGASGTESPTGESTGQGASRVSNQVPGHDSGEGGARTAEPGPYGYSVAGHGSHYSFESRSAVSLFDSAQSGARAVNLVNVSSGDSAAGVNIWGDGGADGTLKGDRTAVDQINDITQADGTAARLTGWSSGAAESFSTSETSTAFSTSSAFVRDVERLWTGSGRTVETTSSVSVDNPRLTIPDSIEPDPVGFGFVVRKTVRVPDPVELPGDDATDFTFNFSVTGAELTLPTVDLTGPSITADKAVVRLPDINLGSVFVSRGAPDSDGNCSAVKGCIRRSFDLGTLKGREFTLNGPVEIFRNPFYNAEIDIPIGVGAASYGTGTITFGEGSDRLSFAARLDLASILKNLDLDLFSLIADGVELPVVGENSDLVGAPDLADFFPEVEFNPVVFEEIYPGFTLEASGGNAPLCGGVNADCAGDTVITTTGTTAPEKTVESAAASRSGESRSAVFSAHYRAGSSVAGAEGEYLIISGSGLDVSREAAIGLGGGAQAGMAVVNSVNASATVVGNALNMGRTGGPAAPATANQGNFFNQRR